MDKICKHCFVSGIVQGVFYRRSTQIEAQKLGLTGWVRNLPDSRVEVLVCGEKSKVDVLLEWLKQGPINSSVSGVEQSQVEWQEWDDFNIK